LDKRLQLMTAGAEDLEQWMLDAIRQGLAALDKRDEEWSNIASRMIDAKSRGLAEQIKIIATDREEGWPERMMETFGQLYLSTQGIQNFEKLPEALKEQVLQVAGVTIRQKELLEQEGIQDHWLVLSRWQGINREEAAMQKTWLYGLEAQQIALLIEFDYMGDGFKHHFQIGQTLKGELIYFPQSYPVRALLKNWAVAEKTESTLIPFADTAAFLREYAKALTANPWLTRFPLLIENMIPLREEDHFFLLDKEEEVIPMTMKDIAGWTLLSISATKPLILFGEWDGKSFHPLAVFMGQRFVDLGAMVSDISGAKRFGGFGR
jgi:hypothetical protein